MTCDEIDELAGAIALDAIPPDEWPAINEHLATCPRGHPRVRELREVAVLLLEAAPPVEPPAALRGRILAAARAEAGDAGAPAPPASPAPVPIAPPPTPIRRPLPRAGWANAGWFATAAAVVVAAALGLWALSLRDDLDRTEERLAAAEQQLDTQRDALAALTGDGEEFRFRATLPGAGGSVVRPEGGAAALILHGLPPVNAMTYQVWALRDGRPTSLGVFAPDPSGRTVVALNHDLRDVDVVAITLEPGPRGSPGPTSEPVLVAPLAG
jgi:hypothetical protein